MERLHEPPEADNFFTDECFRLHNKARRAHGCPPLMYSQDLGEKAKQVAEELARRRFMIYEERFTDIGENATFFPPKFTAADCMNFWLSEEKRYDYNAGHWQQGTNYFTQIIWKSTSEVGIGRSLMKHQSDPTKNQAVVVALYRPTGNSNKPGEFIKNVPRPLTTRSHEGTPVDAIVNGNDCSMSTDEDKMMNGR